jgi:hypothetical protein
MVKKSYFEKLKDPRWQKKRLEVLSHHEFACQKCGDSESPLHVHHKEYFKDRDPWDYELDQLTVLCDSCHEEFHYNKDLLKYICSFLNLDGMDDRDSIALIIAGYIGFDIQKLLEGSQWEDCEYIRHRYDIGAAAKMVSNRMKGAANA